MKAVPRPLAPLVAAVVFVGVLAACGGGSGNGGGSAQSSPAPTGAVAHDPQVLQGRTIFQTYCATCHGIAGGGGVGPSFADGKLLRDFADVDAEMAFVKRGQGVMPAFAGTLNDAQIRAVVRYEREVLSKQK